MGGAQYQAKCLVEGVIKSERYKVFCLSKNVDESRADGDYELINIAQRKGLSRYGFVFDVFRLYRILKELKPDVIYQRVGCSYTGVCAYYAKINRIGMVWNIAHDNDVLPHNYMASPIFIVKRIDKYILEYGIRNASLIVAQTRQQSDFMESNYGRAADEVIRNFHPYPKELIIKGTKIIKVLWVANFKSWKKPEAFIELARRFKNKDNVRFVMIGEPSPETSWQEKLEREIEVLSNLSYLGKLSQDQVNEEMATADIFVNTSLYEGFANTFIQAWMRRVPVVSLHFNPDDLLTSGEIGLHSGSFDKLVKGVKDLVDDEDRRKVMGENAQLYAFQHHSFENIDRIIQLFESAK